MLRDVTLSIPGKPAEINIVDLWANTGPATGINNPASKNCTQENQTSCVYEDYLFVEKVMGAIRGTSSNGNGGSSGGSDGDSVSGRGRGGDGPAATTDEDSSESVLTTGAAATAAASKKPFFIFWAPRIVHSPLQVPQKELDHFSFINSTARAYYHAMVYYIDEAIGKNNRTTPYSLHQAYSTPSIQ